MSDPVRHHYLPEFYQKQWCLEGKVKVFRRYHGSVSVLSKAPKATGWKKNLYATEEVEGLDRYFLERDVLRRVDNDAARALRYLQTYSHGPTDDRLTSAWTRFLLTLLHRAPAQIADIRKIIPEHASTIFADIKDRFPHVDDEAIRSILLEKKTHEGVFQDLLQGLFTQGEVGNAIHSMHWCLIRLGINRFDFLSSDRPLIMSNGLGWSNSFILLPVGPQLLFVAYYDRRIADHMIAVPARDLVQTVNDIVVRQAEEFVIARDERQRRFIENRLLNPTVRPVRGPSNEVRWAFPGLFRTGEVYRVISHGRGK